MKTSYSGQVVWSSQLKFTNILLTIIAVCMLYQCLHDSAPPATAYSDTVDVRIVGVSNALKSLPVELKKISSSAGLSVWSIPVEVKNTDAIRVKPVQY